MLGRFRKVGNLGHFLTPTCASWSPSQDQFLVSYRESLISIFDAQSGREVQDLAFSVADESRSVRGSRQEMAASTQINTFEICPEFNMLVAATEDSKLRFFDLNS